MNFPQVTDWIRSEKSDYPFICVALLNATLSFLREDAFMGILMCAAAANLLMIQFIRKTRDSL